MAQSASNVELFEALDALEKEKTIPKDYMLEKIRTALLTAVKRDNAVVDIDEVKKTFRMYYAMKVVEEVENPLLEVTLEQAKLYNKKAAVKLDAGKKAKDMRDADFDNLLKRADKATLQAVVAAHAVTAVAGKVLIHIIDLDDIALLDTDQVGLGLLEHADDRFAAVVPAVVAVEILPGRETDVESHHADLGRTG